MAVLDGHKHLISDLWLDQPDAHARIASRLAAGSITAEDAARLAAFVDDGFVEIASGLSDAFFERFQADVDRTWAERPAGVGIGLPLQNGRCSIRDVPASARERHYRLSELHSFTETARQLYVAGPVMRLVDLIFDEPGVAFQSLYFERGSEQGLHRDPMFVGTTPKSHLVAAWTALEDIEPGSGPLCYVPGSHRMPWFEFTPDEISALSPTAEVNAAWRRHRDRMVEEMGLQQRELTCARGTVFIWHGGLLHGGAPVTDPTSTRRSFVVHYSTLSTYVTRRARLRGEAHGVAAGTATSLEAETAARFEIDGHVGLESPFVDAAERPPDGEGSGRDGHRRSDAGRSPTWRRVLRRARTAVAPRRRPGT